MAAILRRHPPRKPLRKPLWWSKMSLKRFQMRLRVQKMFPPSRPRAKPLRKVASRSFTRTSLWKQRPLKTLLKRLRSRRPWTQVRGPHPKVRTHQTRKKNPLRKLLKIPRMQHPQPNRRQTRPMSPLLPQLWELKLVLFNSLSNQPGLPAARETAEKRGIKSAS